jgi:tRNA-(ms[2]io[6]A)-hydroxylase
MAMLRSDMGSYRPAPSEVAQEICDGLAEGRTPCRGVGLSVMAPIRRLPVLQDASTSDDERPAWHWAVIGAVFTLSTWAPLAMVASWAGARTARRMLGDALPDELAERMKTLTSHDRVVLWLALTAAPLVAYALSCFAAGALVGRFGAKAGPREAAVGGALAAVVGAGLTVVVSSFAAAMAGLLVLLPLGIGAGWMGGRLGLRRRVAGATRSPPPP